MRNHRVQVFDDIHIGKKAGDALKQHDCGHTACHEQHLMPRPADIAEPGGQNYAKNPHRGKVYHRHCFHEIKTCFLLNAYSR